jgi:hypothetical protein
MLMIAKANHGESKESAQNLIGINLTFSPMLLARSAQD